MAHETCPPSLDLEMETRLHQLVTGYRASQVVSTVARFRIADRLASGPVILDHLAVSLDIAHDHLYRLLQAAVTIGLVQEVAPRTFALAALGEPLRSDVAGSLRSYAMALTAPGHWLPWARLPHAVVSRQSQTTPTLGSDIGEYLRQHPDEGRLLVEAMSEFNQLLSLDIVRLYDLSPFRRVIDMGRWQAALLAAVLDANGVARGLVVDGPELGEEARNRLESRGLSDRADRIAVASSEALPPEGDLYLLEQLLHDRPDEEVSRVLGRCREAMGGDGRIVAVEMALFPNNEPARSQLSDLNSLVITGGRQRSTHAYRALFASAGLELEHVIRLRLEPDFALLVGVPV